MNLDFIPIKTRIVTPPQDEIWDIIDSLEVQDGDLIFITSKILAIHQGRTAKIGSIKKLDLIKQESTAHLPYTHPSGFQSNLTITDGTLNLAAGIDESNAAGHYILWPKDPDELCRKIRTRLIKKHSLKNLGIITTDSHTTPLRLGVTGLAIGLAGIYPLHDIRGQQDLFGRPMHLTEINLIDPLAAAAVLLMGESSEQTPIIILRNFTAIPFDEKGSLKDLKILPEEDIYRPLLSIFNSKTRVTQKKT